ncbi:MAG: GlsB/YeaQ/YmgE family stress response membrane protein [Cyclonatronaceae bacterium]
MSILELFILLLIAGICGAIGQSIAGINRGGCIVSIVVGFIGALIGNWLSDYFGLPGLFTVEIGGQPFPVLWSIIGSILFVALVGFITPRR